MPLCARGRSCCVPAPSPRPRPPPGRRTATGSPRPPSCRRPPASPAARPASPRSPPCPSPRSGPRTRQTSLQMITCFTPQFPGGAAPCFVTLPRNTRRHAQAGAGAGQGEEVRLVPYFDGVGPRTSAAGSLDPQQQGDSLALLSSCPCKDAEHC